MILELKHLASYLPYRLKGIDGKYRCELIGVLDNDPFSLGELRVEYNQDDTGYDYATINLCSFKPILRPLSDLTKEIDGVVHFEIIKEAFPNVPNFYSLLRTRVLDNYPLSDTNVEYCIVDYLIQHHFDVYGLIEKGLAIDINKIENV